MNILSHTNDLLSFILKEVRQENSRYNLESYLVKIANPSKDLYYFEPEMSILSLVDFSDLYVDIKMSSLVIFENPKNPTTIELYNLFRVIHAEWDKLIQNKIYEDNLLITLPKKIASFTSMQRLLDKALKKMNSLKN